MASERARTMTISHPSTGALSVRQQPTPSVDGEQTQLDVAFEHEHYHGHGKESFRHRMAEEQNITISSTSKQAERMVAPFLAEHIPAQYNPVGSGPRTRRSSQESVATPERPLTNSKFCYRHRPDLKCRRQANEPSMEQLQNELASLSQSDQQAISHVWSLFSAAPGKHRNLMLQGILTQCCFPQLSFISANVRDLIKIDFLSALPAELGYKVLCYLDTTSLCKAAQVSQRWRELADDDVVWHKMCEQHIDRKCTKCGWGLPLLERKRLRTEKRQIQLRATGRGINEWSPNITPLVEPEHAECESKKRRSDSENLPSPTSLKRQRTHSSSEGEPVDGYFAPKKRPWKDVYRDRFKVGTAWKYGRCSTQVFKGHSNGVMALQFDDNVLITGSYDATAKVWDIKTGQEIRTLSGHNSGIRCLQFDDTKLMTGSLDGTLRLWNWKTGQCLRVFPAHTQGIITLHFNGRYVASGSMDGTARVWDSETKQTFLLRGHTDWVNCVKLDEASRTLFTASDDLSVRLWDLDTKECIRVFDGHVGQVQVVLPMPPEFELDEVQHNEKDDDASSVSSVHATQEETTPFWPDQPDRAAPPRYMFTGALDSTIRLWDVHALSNPQQPAEDRLNHSTILATDPLTNSHIPRAQACIRTFFGHVEGIWALAANHLRLISGSEDRMLKIWDPRSGKCERSISGHAGPVTCAWLSDSRVATGSEDCEVRMLTFGEF